MEFELSTNASLEELEATRQKLVDLLLEIERLDIDGRAHELKVVHAALKIIDELIAEKRKQ